MAYTRLLLIAAIIAAASYLAAPMLDLPTAAAATWKASGIVALAAFAAAHRAWVLTAALIASATGDVALALEPAAVVSGIAAFALAHVLYTAIFIGRIPTFGLSRPGIAIAALIIVYGAAMLVWQRPDMDAAVRGPASAYNVIILMMAATAALQRGPALILIGAVLFVSSDSLIALRWFKGILEWAGPVVWITYAGAQVSLVLGVLSGREDDASPRPA